MKNDEMNKQDNELNHQQATQVSGGVREVEDGTLMVCTNPACKFVAGWVGDYVGQTVDCPQCKEHTFTGERKVYVR